MCDDTTQPQQAGTKAEQREVRKGVDHHGLELCRRVEVEAQPEGKPPSKQHQGQVDTQERGGSQAQHHSPKKPRNSVSPVSALFFGMELAAHGAAMACWTAAQMLTPS